MSSVGAGRGRGAPSGRGRGRGRGASPAAGRGRGRGRGRGSSSDASPSRPAFVAPVYTSPTANLTQEINRGWASLAAGAVQRTTGYDVSARAEQFADVMLVLNQISNSDLKPNFGYKSRFRMSAS